MHTHVHIQREADIARLSPPSPGGLASPSWGAGGYSRRPACAKTRLVPYMNIKELIALFKSCMRIIHLYYNSPSPFKKRLIHLSRRAGGEARHRAPGNP